MDLSYPASRALSATATPYSVGTLWGQVFVRRYEITSPEGLEEAAEVPRVRALDDDAVLEGESGHSPEVDRAARGGHAEPVAAMGAAGAPAHGDGAEKAAQVPRMPAR